MIADVNMPKSFGFIDGITNHGLCHTNDRRDFSLGYTSFRQRSYQCFLFIIARFLNFRSLASNVLPYSKRLDLVNMSFINFEPFSYRFVCKSRFAQSSDFQYLLVGKFVKRAEFPVRNKISSFFGHVLHVFSVRSKKQMRRIYTYWVIALVKAVQTIFDFSIYNHPSNSVSLDRPPVDTELTISVIIDTKQPSPTFIRFSLLHLYPKPVNKWISNAWGECVNVLTCSHVVMLSYLIKESI